MHFINVMTKALAPGDDRGVTILMGGKRSLKIGDQLGTVVIPFFKLESDEDFEALEELGETVIDFFAENALEHERVGETIDRIGLANFLEAIGVEIDPNMINHPRTNSYVRTDTWDEEAEKWNERKAEKDAAKESSGVAAE
jgi:sulfite reductase alpha subunit